MQRRRKTNLMLVVVSVTFFISWAPLNIFNMVLDITALFKVRKKNNIFGLIGESMSSHEE